MKKVVSVLALVCAAVMLLGVSAFAAGNEIELPDTPFENAQSVTESFDGIYRFINKGEKPDLSAGSVTAYFDGGQTQELKLDDESLPAFPKTDTVGRLTYSFEAFGTAHSIEFIVVDTSYNYKKFTDLSKSFWGFSAIRNMLYGGFMKGMSETEFKPKNNMTRAEFCQMMYNVYKGDTSVMLDRVEATDFADLPDTKWSYEAVMACARAGIVNGVGDGMFEPESPIKRQEAVTIMMRILYGENLNELDADALLASARESGIPANDFDTVNPYARKAYAAALGLLINGDPDGNVTPQHSITRADSAQIMSNYFFKGYTAPEIKRLVYLSPENRDNPYTGVNATEHQQMQLVAEYVQKRLTELGYDVYIADKSLSIQEANAPNNRSTEAQMMGADVYVALHSNARGNANSPAVHGTESFYNGNNKGAKELSQFIYDRLTAITPYPGRGNSNDMLTEKPFVEVRLPTMANVLLETYFHDNAEDAGWIVNNIERIGECVALGIDDYLKTLD